jgi:molecular chaperone GrpE
MSDPKIVQKKTGPDGTDRAMSDHDVETTESSASPSAEEIEALRKAARERDEFLDLLQRTRAEFENYQKRNQKDRELERRYQFTPLLYDLLPIVDDFERALESAKNAGETGPLADGVKMILSKFLELFKRYGVTRMDALGKPFDPNVHQAVMQRPVADVPVNTVVEVCEHGYMNQDRVLRAAKVLVSTTPEEKKNT